jgi:hypothetical protein
MLDLKPVTGATGATAEAEPEKKTNQATRIVMMLNSESGSGLFRSDAGDVYIHIPESDARPAKDYLCPSEELSQRILLFFCDVTGNIPSRDAVKGAMQYLQAEALTDPDIPTVKADVRHTFTTDDAGKQTIYLDLCEPGNSRAIAITAQGYKIVDEPKDAVLIRPNGSLPLPIPDKTDTKEAMAELRTLLRCATEDDWVAAVKFLVCCLAPFNQRLILFLGGTAGSGKTTFMRLLRHLFDPTVHSEAVRPRKEDFFILAKHCAILCVDNVSGIPVWFADYLCCLATGATAQQRELYSNYGLCSFRFHRAVVLTSIADLAWREDLGSRAVDIRLHPITERISDDELIATVERLRPKILHALCNAASHALACPVKGVVVHRMQAVADWFASCAPALDITVEQMRSSNEASAIDLTEAHLDSSPIADPIIRMCEDYIIGGKVGINQGSEYWPTPHTKTWATADLYREIDAVATLAEKRNKHWPDGSRALGQKLGEITTSLPTRGIEIVRAKSGNWRGWTFDWKDMARVRTLPKAPRGTKPKHIDPDDDFNYDDDSDFEDCGYGDE